MKIKTPDLIDKPLDWAVAIALGARLESQSGGMTWLIGGAMLGYERSYTPSTDWDQGGPIIEQEDIAFTVNHHENCPPELKYTAFIRNLGTGVQGPSHLIAAMRCFVASKLGDDVEIPEGLMS